MNENEIKAAEISERISQLEELSVENLKGEMASLKKALLENPAACLLLKDEDVGQLVISLRKLTGQALASAATKTSKPAKEKTVKTLSAAELKKALEEEDF